MMRSARRRIDDIIRKNRETILLLCFFLASVFVGVVGAVIYNWVYIDGSARIGAAFVFSFRNSLCYSF